MSKSKKTPYEKIRKTWIVNPIEKVFKKNFSRKGNKIDPRDIEDGYKEDELDSAQDYLDDLDENW